MIVLWTILIVVNAATTPFGVLECMFTDHQITHIPYGYTEAVIKGDVDDEYRYLMAPLFIIGAPGLQLGCTAQNIEEIIRN